MAFCFAHAAVEATGTCDDCKKPICTKCTKGTLEGFMCPPCAHKRYGRRKLVTGLKVGGLMAVVLGVAVLGIFGFGRKPAGDRPKEDPHAEKDPYIASLREQRDQAPCDKEAVVKLVRELVKLKRNADAVDDGKAYFAKCGAHPRIDRELIYPLRQLGRYAEAIKHTTVLVERDPYDSDYWWWRAEDRDHTNEHPQALADLRQSFANSANYRYSRFAAARILDIAGPAGQPCEGVLALDYFVDAHGGTLAHDLDQRRAGLDLSAQCAARRGRGAAALPPPADAGTTVEVTIGDVAGTFLVEERCGTTALSTAFAQLVQLAPRAGAPRVETIAAGKIRSGLPAAVTLAIGKAVGPDTEVVIVDDLPAGIDGVVGLSFLWKFELTRRDDDGGLSLSDGTT